MPSRSAGRAAAGRVPSGSHKRAEPAAAPRRQHGVAFHRSRGPCSRLQRAFRLTNIPSKSTVKPRDGDYSKKSRMSGSIRNAAEGCPCINAGPEAPIKIDSAAGKEGGTEDEE